jgi:hypothetical protein
MAFSGQRKLAFDTGFNDALFGRDRNNPYDQAVVGGSYAAYEEGYESGLISDTPPRGPQGEQGDKGDKGTSGSGGTAGSDGVDGTSVLTGTGAPGAGLGNNGDVYIDGDNGDIYEKITGTWNLIGSPNGVAQTTRTDTDGGSPETIYRGTAVPGSAESASVWRMERITIATDGDVNILFEDGNDQFNNDWDGRAAGAYS